MSIKKSHKFTAQFLEEVAAETRYRKLGVRVGGSSWMALSATSRWVDGKEKLDHGHKFPKFGWDRRC